MAKKYFTKKSLTPSKQISLLKERGITFTDYEQALHYLTYHNYYFISGYIYYFEKKSAIRTHELERKVDFSDIIELVNFDQSLRNLCFQAIQTIEIAVRTSIARNLSLQFGPFCLENENIYFDASFSNNLMKIIDDLLKKHKSEAFITHFTNTYIEKKPPVWITIELLTFGNISKIYSNLIRKQQKNIARDFKVDHTILVSWLKALTELRNTCAHHNRLWNKVFVNFPKIRKVDMSFPIHLRKRNHLGSFLPLFFHLLEVIDENRDIEDKLLELFKKCKLIKSFDLGLEKWWK